MSQHNQSECSRNRKPKLLEQVRHRCRTQHLALSTEKQYVSWIRRFILFHNKRHPLDMGKREVGSFLTHLAVDGNVAASTQNQALAALLFLYRAVLERDFGWLDGVVRAKKPKRLPVVFTVDEARMVINELRGIRWLMAMLLYGGGLRLQECLRLRVKDLDFDRLQVIVRDGKGEKDRVTLLPEALVTPLKRHLHGVRQLHERALREGFGGGSSCPTHWHANTLARIASGPGSTYFPRQSPLSIRAAERGAVIIYTRPSCKTLSGRPSAIYRSTSWPAAIRFVIPLQHI